MTRSLLLTLAFAGCAKTDEKGGDADSDTDTDTDTDTGTGTETETETDTGTDDPCPGEDPHGLCDDPVDLREEGEQDAEGLSWDGSTAGRCDRHAGSCAASSDADLAVVYVPDVRADVVVRTEEGDVRIVLYARTDCDDAADELACGVDTVDGTSLTLEDRPAGEPIYVIVDGAAGQQGDFRIRVRERRVAGDGEDCDPAGVESRCEDELTCQDGVCAPLCGNGEIDPGEECDDGGTDAGDGCDDGCAREPMLESEPNEVCADAEEPGIDGILAAGAFVDDFDEDWWSITLTAGGALEIWTNDVSADGCGFGCGGGTDTNITLYDVDCATELADNDDNDVDYCSLIPAMDLPAGTYYVQVTATFLGFDPNYELEAALR